MPLYLTEDQAMLRDTAQSFMAEQGSIKSQLRHWRDRGCKDGFGHGLWKQFAEMGFTGLRVPEGDGGLGLGHVEAGIVLEEIGRNLTPSPFLTTAIAFVEAVRDSAVRDRWLPGILAGDTVAALAVDEGRKHRPEQVDTRAERSGNGFRLNGRKSFVVHGGSADVLLVAARTGGSAGERDGLTLFAVDRNTDGLDVRPERLVDSAMAAAMTFDNVEVDADAVIGDVDGGWTLLTRVLNAGRAGASAEMVGVATGAMDMTVDYLRQRTQFGVAIGTFQALQHRAAHLYSELEIARAATLKAQQLLNEGDAEADLMVSVAKAKAGRTATLAVQEGVQMHGGIGMTDEHDIGLYMKRDRALNELFGDVNYHTNRVAELKGY
jgi:alkylation response protein AidB-like acyl-CoA dehydrogenase